MSQKITSAKGLTKLFHELNRQFFGGRLPRYRVTLAGSRKLEGLAGFCIREHRLIRLRRRLDPESLRRMLLHEMCHIEAPGHGRRFQQKLRRLARRGEAWAKEEADAYPRSSWNEEMVNLARKIKDLPMNLRLAPPPNNVPKFRTVVDWLAHDLGMLRRDFVKSVPWVKAAWNKAWRDYDRYLALRENFEKRRMKVSGTSATPGAPTGEAER